MERFLRRVLLYMLTLLLTAAGCEEIAMAQQTNAPPLVDRELFFGNPQYAGAQISPDGTQIAFRSVYEGKMNIWVKGVDEPFDAARPITADTTRPVQSYFWTQDGERVLYIQDKGGNENYHIYAVDPQAAADPDTGVPLARDLTPYESVQARIYAVPEATPGEIVVGLNDRDQRYHDVYRLDLASGERTLVLQNDDGVAGWQTDLDGTVRLAVRQTDDGGTEILRVDDGALSDPVYTCSPMESCGPVRFHKDGARVYMQTNKGDDVDLTRLVLFNPQTQAMEVVESDPEGDVDFGGAEFSDDTDELVATYYLGDRLRIYPKDDQFAQDLETIRRQVPEGEIYFGASTNDDTKHIVRVQRDVDPGSTYLYDRAAGTVERLYQSRPDLPSEHLAPMEAIRYEARDGLTIPAYLTTPRGPEAQNLPVVVVVHGGPWARDTWGYNPYAQFLANRGYAVLQPNFRGSTGYGKSFLNAGNEAWGDAMQHDITDGVQHLIDEGIADPERVAIFGASYGGYATLAGLTFTPDVYAAGVSYVGPSNIITLLEAIPPYWGPIKKIFDIRVGDLDDEADRERLRRQSPLFSAEQIDDPLMVIQGANDPRVPQRESDQMVVAARENSVDVQYLVAENEGHGFSNEDNRLAVAAAMEQFFAQHLGGRVQTDMEDAVAATLGELRVDPSTVTRPEAPDEAAAEAAKTAPLPEADGSAIRPATMQYTATVNMQGRSIDLDVTRTIEEATHEGQAVWRVVDESQSPMGASVDTFAVDRAALTPVRRSAGGQGSMTLRYTDDAITGQMSGMGQTLDIDRSLDAPVLGDGAGLELALAGLDLSAGYTATYRVFNPQQQAVQPMTLTVAGTETVAVPAGSFDTYVVEIEPVESGQGQPQTLYLAADAPHHVIKSEAKLPPQMGGGTVTRELASMSTGATSMAE